MTISYKYNRVIHLIYIGMVGLFLVQCAGEPIIGDSDGSLSVTPQSLNFSEITDLGSKALRFSNSSADSIIVTDVSINEPSFNFKGPVPFTVHAAENVEYDVGFNYSAYTGQDSVKITITNTDSASNPITIDVVTPFKRIVTNLSNSNRNEYPVTYNPSGSRILFYTEESSSRKNIHTMTSSGEDKQQLTNSRAQNIPVAYAPDSSRILYYSNITSDNIFNIYSMATDGSDVQQLTDNGDHEYAVGYSHDGSIIAYYRNVATSPTDNTVNNEVYIMNADGSNQVQITDNEADDRPSVFSINDQYIIFKSNRNGNSDIFRVSVSGSGLRQLTEEEGDDYAVDVSTDNRLLIYSEREGRREVYTMSMEGTDLIRLTDNYWYDAPAAYNSDGGSVLITSFKAGNIDVYKASIRGSIVERITSDTDEDRPISFSPDDEEILFYSFRTGKAQIFVTNN